VDGRDKPGHDESRRLRFKFQTATRLICPVVASASEAIHAWYRKEESWIASSRSLSSGAHSRDPLAPRNDGTHTTHDLDQACAIPTSWFETRGVATLLTMRVAQQFEPSFRGDAKHRTRNP
jgi:hypothetical protein